MKSFEHINAQTVNEAVGLLQERQGKLIAGGTDLLGVLKSRVLPTYPELLVNIKSIPGLDGIERDGEGVKIGALAKLADVAASPLVKEEYPMLAEAAESVAVPQIRNMGTIGGNLTQDTRCWYYRYPHEIGGRILCYLKGGKGCYALTGDNRYHSIFGGWREASSPCTSACPGNVDIPSYLSKIREGDLPAAASILLDANPLPAITGRVCLHFCEQECNRGDFDESVSVRDIERFMGDYILQNTSEIIKAPETSSGKRVAVVGSGPAGLTAAYYLAKSGHSVTIFEALAEPGGTLRVGIPRYRLPEDILDAEIATIKNVGVDIRTNTEIDSLDTIFAEGFNAILVAVGAHQGTTLPIPGVDLDGVLVGLEFLKKVNLGEEVKVGQKALVLGGGSVAFDCARTALRLGAADVSIACLEAADCMLATPEDIAEGQAEGVTIHNSRNFTKIIEENGRVSGVECLEVQSFEFDEDGGLSVETAAGSEHILPADIVIFAIGQRPVVPEGFELATGRGNTIEVDEYTHATDRDGVFAAGDAVTGAASVIEAIAAGRKAALAINTYLGGTGDGEPDRVVGQPFLTCNREYLKETSRVKAPKLPIAERSLNVEDNGGLALNEMANEANRCLNCSCVAVNSSDIGLALVALDARVTIAGPGSVRTVPIGEFFSSLGNILEGDEMVTEIQVPRPPEGARQTFLKHRVREAVDFAIVSVASVITEKGGKCEDARIVLGAVAPTPLRAVGAEQIIKGKTIDGSSAEAAAVAAVAGAVPLGQNAYKVEIAKALVKRALLSQGA